MRALSFVLAFSLVAPCFAESIYEKAEAHFNSGKVFAAGEMTIPPGQSQRASVRCAKAPSSDHYYTYYFTVLGDPIAGDTLKSWMESYAPVYAEPDAQTGELKGTYIDKGVPFLVQYRSFNPTASGSYLIWKTTSSLTQPSYCWTTETIIRVGQ